jgi:GT2 family glycosyltransferase
VANADLFDANGQLNTAAKLLYANDLDWAKQLQRAGVRKMLISHTKGKRKEVIIWCQLEI